MNVPIHSNPFAGKNSFAENNTTFIQRRRLHRSSAAIIIISFIAFAAVLLAIYAFMQKKEANDQANLARQKTVEALQQQKIALEQRIIADSNKENALHRQEQALESDKNALKEKEIADLKTREAEEQRLEAFKQTLLAKAQMLYANEQKMIAQQKTQEAETLKVVATVQTNIAKEETKISNELKELVYSRTLANEAVLLFNENSFDSSKSKAMQAYLLNKKNNGPQQNNDIYKALNINWIKSTANRNQYLIHHQSVHCITGMPGNNIIFTADESGAIYGSILKDNGLQKLFSYSIEGKVRALAVSPDGSRLVAITASGNGTVFKVFNSNLSVLSNFKFPGIGKSVAFNGNDYFIFLSSNGIGQCQLTNVFHQEFLTRDGINAFAVDKSGQFYIAAGNSLKSYKNWDDLTNELPRTNQKFETTINCIAIDANAAYIAAGTNNGFVWLNKLKGSNNTAWYRALHLSVVKDLKFGLVNKGKIQLASAGADQTIKLIDVKAALLQNNSEDIITLTGHSKWIWQLYYTPDGQSLFSTGEDNKIIAWKPTTADLYESLYNK